MKRSFVFLLVLALALGCCACSGSGGGTAASTAQPAEPTETGERPEVFSQDEYTLYQNIFYNGYGPQFEGKTVQKEGVFASVVDAYNGVVRYYVWGYYDQTRCCDWQWEFVPKDGEDMPQVGSQIAVKGTFASDEAALDGYWIVDAEVLPQQVYTGDTAEIDMRSMSCTLERVQMYNVMYRSDSFEGREFSAYGRIASLDPLMLEDPYYDGSWQNAFTWGGEVPAIGTTVVLHGNVAGGALDADSLEAVD
jgi:hypothetical protein